MERHISNARQYGAPVVVALNRFASDTDAELDVVKRAALDAGAVFLSSRV
jgi:formyltetrahydrofolate synthetase